AVRRQDRRAARERLQRRETKSLVRTRRDEQVDRRKKVGELLAVLFVRQEPHPRCAVGLRHEPGPHWAVADERDLRTGPAMHLAPSVEQHAEFLLLREPAHEGRDGALGQSVHRPHLAPPHAARRMVVGEVHAERNLGDAVDPRGTQIVRDELRGDDRVREVPVDDARVAPREVVHRAAERVRALRKRREDTRKIAVIKRDGGDVEPAGREAHDPRHEAGTSHLDDVGTFVLRDAPVRARREHEPIRILRGDARPFEPVAAHTVALRKRVARTRKHEHLTQVGVRLYVQRLLPQIRADAARGLAVELGDVENRAPRVRPEDRRQCEVRQIQPRGLELRVRKEDRVDYRRSDGGHRLNDLGAGVRVRLDCMFNATRKPRRFATRGRRCPVPLTAMRDAEGFWRCGLRNSFGGIDGCNQTGWRWRPEDENARRSAAVASDDPWHGRADGNRGQEVGFRRHPSAANQAQRWHAPGSAQGPVRHDRRYVLRDDPFRRTWGERGRALAHSAGACRPDSNRARHGRQQGQERPLGRHPDGRLIETGFFGCPTPLTRITFAVVFSLIPPWRFPLHGASPCIRLSQKRQDSPLMPSKRPRRIASALILVAGGLAVAACGEKYPNSTFTHLTDFNTIIDGLWNRLLLLGTIVFVIVEALLVFTIIKFRKRDGAPAPKQTHGNSTLEITWTIIPVIILVLIAVPTVSAIWKTEAKASANSIQVQVIGHQWWWEFRYPQYGVVTANELYLPAGRTANFQLNSRDVIHSFWTPQLGGKR